MDTTKYPCIKCKSQCENDVIECSVCLNWIHRKCVPMSCATIIEWKSKSLEFICLNCSHANGHYDFEAALQRYL